MSEPSDAALRLWESIVATAGGTAGSILARIDVALNEARKEERERAVEKCREIAEKSGEIARNYEHDSVTGAYWRQKADAARAIASAIEADDV